MSSQDDNVAVVLSALEAFERRDMETVLSVLDPEIQTFSSPELANPVDAVGREQWLQWMGDWLDAWEGFEVEFEKVEPVGQHHVVVDMYQRARGKESGVGVELRVYTMFEIREGIAKRYHLYPDREQALEAAREGESA